MKKIHLYLISDSTGETVAGVARAALAQFDEVEAEEHNWALIRTDAQLQKALEEVKENPGIVFYTMIDPVMKEKLKNACLDLRVPCVAVLGRAVKELSDYLGQDTSAQIGKQHELDEEYFGRMEAVNFALTCDDGQSAWNMQDADIVLVGPSRTSKTPTCIYLAYRGYKAANVPFVLGCPLPEGMEAWSKPLFIGLTINPEALIEIRRNRLVSIKESGETNYVNQDEVRSEVAEARKLYAKNRWPVIDVTRRSVEETAATIVQIFQEHR
jgi:regulator of PEP synthase PpsR (kinase-PPPase family)